VSRPPRGLAVPWSSADRGSRVNR